jgi:hypothetical protein
MQSVQGRSQEERVVLLKGVRHHSVGRHLVQTVSQGTVVQTRFLLKHTQGHEVERQSRAIDSIQDNFTMNASPDHNIDVLELLRNFPAGVFMIINEAVFAVGNVSVVAHGDCPTMTGEVPSGRNFGWQRNNIEVPNGIRESQTSLGGE